MVVSPTPAPAVVVPSPMVIPWGVPPAAIEPGVIEEGCIIVRAVPEIRTVHPAIKPWVIIRQVVHIVLIIGR